MTSIAAIRAWPLDRLGTTAAALDSGAQQFRSAARAATAPTELHTEWHGETYATIAHRLVAQGVAANRMLGHLEAAAQAGREACTGLTQVRGTLLHAIDTAVGKGFTVADDGTVTHPSGRRGGDALFLTYRITGLLACLTSLDQEAGHRLTQLAGQLALSHRQLPRPGGGWGDPRSVLAQLPGIDQAALRAFWEQLTAGEVQALIDADPAIVGNLYGVPFADRIRANRVAITETLRAEERAGRGDGPRARELRAMLAPATGVDGKPVPRQFVAFSPDGVGSYIEQIGELEPGIQGVGVFVPGTGTNLNNASEQRRRGLALARKSGGAVFVFADGALPQQVVPQGEELRNPSAYRGTAVDGEPARLLGRQLVGFGLDLDAEIAQSAPGAATTYLGHSYGGSVVGTAEQYGLRADRIVFASSAGTGAADGPWRDPNPGVQRYSLTPPGDPIHWAQKYGAPVHGGDPDAAAGVQRLDSGWYSIGSHTPGALIEGIGAHSSYLDDPDSTAFTNLADVIAGRTPTSYVERAPDIPQRGADAALNGLLGGPLLGLLNSASAP